MIKLLNRILYVLILLVLYKSGSIPFGSHASWYAHNERPMKIDLMEWLEDSHEKGCCDKE